MPLQADLLVLLCQLSYLALKLPGEFLVQRKPNLVERLLNLVTPVIAGEGRSLLLMIWYAFVLLLLWYIMRTVRDAVVLSESGAVIKSYATAITAGILIFFIPVYSYIVRRADTTRFLQWISVFFSLNILVFICIALLGINYGVAFIIWNGIFGITMIAQFWAFAAQTYSVAAGQRLFVAIGLGASIGALSGAFIASQSYIYLGSKGMLLLAAVLLASLYFIPPLVKKAVPEEAQSRRHDQAPRRATPRLVPAGFDTVLSSQYLIRIALFVMALNLFTSLSDFILASMVTQGSAEFASAQGISRENWIGSFYGDLFFWVNLSALAVQILLVSRIFRAIGVYGAVLVMPIVMAVLFGVLIFFPVFALVRLVLIVQGSLNYSLRQTAHHSLFLPTDRNSTFEGKTTIDTFFWRFGDLLQGGVVWLGTVVYSLDTAGFIVLNFAIAIIWLGIAISIARPYRRIMFGYHRETARMERMIAYAEFIQVREQRTLR